MSVDAYMNLQLANTEEYIDGQFTGNLGEVLIRWVLLLLLHRQAVHAQSYGHGDNKGACSRRALQLRQTLDQMPHATSSALCRYASAMWPLVALAPCRCNNVLYIRGAPEEPAA